MEQRLEGGVSAAVGFSGNCSRQWEQHEKPGLWMGQRGPRRRSRQVLGEQPEVKCWGHSRGWLGHQRKWPSLSESGEPVAHPGV